MTHYWINCALHRIHNLLINTLLSSTLIWDVGKHQHLVFHTRHLQTVQTAIQHSAKNINYSKRPWFTRSFNFSLNSFCVIVNLNCNKTHTHRTCYKSQFTVWRISSRALRFNSRFSSMLPALSNPPAWAAMTLPETEACSAANMVRGDVKQTVNKQANTHTNQQ